MIGISKKRLVSWRLYAYFEEPALKAAFSKSFAVKELSLLTKTGNIPQSKSRISMTGPMDCSSLHVQGYCLDTIPRMYTLIAGAIAEVMT